MDRPGQVKAGDVVRITECILPSNYYYTGNTAMAMSGNIPLRDRPQSKSGTVVSVEENTRGYYVIVAFDEEEV